MDWEVGVKTQSNFLKTVRVNDCATRSDAEAAALGMTGAKEVTYSTPKSYDDSSDSYETPSNNFSSPDPAGIFLIILVLIVIAAWKYILLFGLIGFVIWWFFFRNK
jgi:hypothetical protein